MDDQTKYKVAGTVLKANDNGSIRFRLITNDLDRDSEVLLPAGAQLQNWKKNGVWLWAHNREAWGGILRPPIGKIVPKTIDQTETALDVDVIFDEENDEFAKMIAAKHRDGFLKATSVGFIPITISKDTVKPRQQGVTHEKFEVLEGSSVPVPANPAALQQNEWGQFIDGCKKYGFDNISIKSWLSMAGWDEKDIEDALISDNLKVNIPYEGATVTATQNFEINDISNGKEAEEQKLDDSEAVVEIDKELNSEVNIKWCATSIAQQALVDEGLSVEEAESAIVYAVMELLEATEEKEDTYQRILDELNSINVFSEPDVSANILDILKEIDQTLKP